MPCPDTAITNEGKPGTTKGSHPLRKFLLMLSALLLAKPVWADLELHGLLLNQTRTFAGQSFYKAFVEGWQELDPESSYNLVIIERPSARSGSQITVKYADQVVFQQFIHFNANKAQRAGQLAPGFVYNKVISADVDELFANPDLAHDEIKLN